MDSISVHVETGQYYYDLGREQLAELAVGNGFRKFFEKLEKESFGIGKLI